MSPFVRMRLLTVAWAAGLVFLGLMAGWSPGFWVGIIAGFFLFYGWLGVGAILAVATVIVFRKRTHASFGAIARNPGLLFICLAIPLGVWFEPELMRLGDGLHFKKSESLSF